MPDLDHFLVPISETSPCGADFSFSAEFDSITEARRADDPTLEQGEWQRDLKTADWPAVMAICERLLTGKTKDLRLAIWMAEAATHLQGFIGLAWGYRLTAALCERYWAALHPCEEGDADDEGSLKIGHLRWLLARSAQWAKELPLTHSAAGNFSANDIQVANARAGNAYFEGNSSERVTLANLNAARQATPFEFYAALSTELTDCVQALEELHKVIDRVAGDDGPSFSACREALEMVSGMAMRFARDAGVRAVGEVPAASDEALGTAGGVTTMSPPALPVSGGELASRQEALAQLRRVAAFFRRTEPHSPVAYLADKAARWGEMPLHVWLRRVIKDDGALSHIEELLDIAPGGESSE